jgi:hypothetical protein
MRKRLLRFWNVISHLGTTVSILGWVVPSVWVQVFGGLLLGSIATVIVWLGQYGPAIGFILICIGLLAGVWIVNGIGWKSNRAPGDPSSAQGHLLVHFQPPLDLDRYMPPSLLPSTQFTSFVEEFLSELYFPRILTLVLINCSYEELGIESLFGKITRFGHVELDKEFILSADSIKIESLSEHKISYKVELSAAEQHALGEIKNKNRAPIQMELTMRLSTKDGLQKVYLNEGDVRRIVLH